MKKQFIGTTRKTASFLLAAIVLTGSFAPILPATNVAYAQTTSTIDTLLAQIQALQAQIAALLAAQGGSSGTSVSGVPAGFRFTRNLVRGSSGVDVRYLQMVLNSNASTQVNTAGSVGGPGSETSFFGTLTRSAVIRFQEKYRAEILTPIGLTQGTGVVATMTRNKLNALLTAGTIPPPPPPPPATTPTLNVAPGTQPTSTLLPPRAARVPLLRVNLSASGSQTIATNNLTFELGGAAQTTAFDGFVLLDASGNVMGNVRTVGSDRRIVFTNPISVAPGTTQTITLAANMKSDLSAQAGQITQASLVGISSNAVATTGSLPIAGPNMTINATLSLGTATTAVGPLGTTAVSRDIGTQDVNFASIRLTAGSSEDLVLRSIRWTQNGSASTGDLANVETIIDTTFYSTFVSGRTYTSIFATPIVIPKGFSKEISIRGDITGGIGRTVAFDIEEESDINVTGSTYGYGILPSAVSTATASDATAEFTTGTPFFDAALVTISGAAVNVSRAATVPAQNVAINAPGQTLGGFEIEIVGEGVTASQLTLNIAITRSSGSSAAVEDIRSITLVGPTGNVVAGPVDATGTGTTGTASLGSVTLPLGRTVYTVRGTLGTDFREGDVITISITPSSDITGIRGVTSGNSSTAAPTTSISAHPMTVRAAAVSLTVSPSPVAQTVVAGVQGFMFANYQFNATGSGEDVRVSSLPVTFTHSASPESLTSCQIYRDGTPVTTGGNILNPSSGRTSGSTSIFTFDTPIVIPRNITTTLSLRCNVSASTPAGTTFSFGLGSSTVTGTGVQSGQSVTFTTTTSVGQTMTVAGSGALSVTKDFSSPGYQMAAANSTVTAGVLNFRAGNEAVNLRRIGLQLTPTSSSASSSPINLTSVTLWDGNTQVGSTFFSGTNRTATTTLTQEVLVPANTDKDITIRITPAPIGTNQPGTEGALIKIDYNGDDPTATQGIGASSGTTINSSTTSDTDMEGVRIFRSIPTFAQQGVPNTTLTSGDMILMRFSVGANTNGPIGIHKFTLGLSTSTASVSNITITGYTDAGFSSPVPGTANGRLDENGQAADGSGNVEIYAENASGTQVPLQVPAGGTRYFEVRGTVTGATSGSSVTTRLLVDSEYPSLATLMGTVSEVDATTNDNFIWSPNLNGESNLTDRDWTNGYFAPGISTSGYTQTISR